MSFHKILQSGWVLGVQLYQMLRDDDGPSKVYG